MLDFKNCFVEEEVFEKKVDINHAVSIFYVLELLYNLTLKKYTPFMPSHEKLLSDIEMYRNIWIKKLSQIIYDYIVIVVGTELRHSYDCSEYYHPDFLGAGWFKNMSRNECFKDRTFEPNSVLKLGENLFNEKYNSWKSGYGGEKWYNIAKAGLMYGNTPDLIFIDHAVDLSHNNSYFFDKGGDILYCFIEDYKFLLDQKFNLNGFRGLIIFIEKFCAYDKNIFNLINRYNILFEKGIVSIPKFSYRYLRIINQKTYSFLHYIPQKFGKTKLNISDICPSGRVFNCGEEIVFSDDYD